MDLRRRVQEVRNHAARQKLVVLVWGPGDPGRRGSEQQRLYWQKRLQIKTELQARFPNSQILFSESEAIRRYTDDLEDTLTEEMLHAAAADCIIILDVSRGAHVEVDRLSTNPTVASKMRLLIPQEHVGSRGLANVLYSGLTVHGFRPAELTSCRVATQKCPSIVMSIAIRRLYINSLGDGLGI